MCPVPGRFCIGMVPGREEGSLRGHAFHFPAGSYTLSKHHCLYGMDFLTRDNLYAAFHPISAGWLRHGYRGGLADVQPRIGTVRFLPYHVAGHCLFFQSGLLCHGAWSQSFSQRIWRRLMVGIYGRDDGGFQYHSSHSHRTGTVRTAGCAGHDDVPYLYSVCNEPGRTAQ